MAFDKDDFLLRADENAEIIADAALSVVRRSLQGELPDPFPITQHNVRQLLKAAYKAGATFGLAEMIAIAEKL